MSTPQRLRVNKKAIVDALRKRHEQELSVIRRANKQLECGEGILFSDDSQRAREAVRKTLATLQEMLSSLSASHRYERSVILTKLKEKPTGKEEKLVLKQQGHLLQERQRQLLLLFRKHQSLSEKLKILNSCKGSSKQSSQTNKSITGSVNVSTVSDSQPVSQNNEILRINSDQQKIPQVMETAIPVDDGQIVNANLQRNPQAMEKTATLVKVKESVTEPGQQISLIKNGGHKNSLNIDWQINRNHEGDGIVSDVNEQTQSTQDLTHAMDFGNIAVDDTSKGIVDVEKHIERDVTNGNYNTQQQKQSADFITRKFTDSKEVDTVEKSKNKSFMKQNILQASEARCLAAGIYVNPVKSQPVTCTESEIMCKNKNPERTTDAVQSIILPQDGSGLPAVQTSKASFTECTMKTSQKIIATVSRKRPMPKQVAEINLLMSPESSLDLSVTTSPRKNFSSLRQISKPPVPKVTPVVPAPQESVLKPVPLNPILKTPGPLKPVPVKKVCKPMDSQLHILQRDLPELKDLVSEGILKPGTQVLSLFTGKRRVFASLTEDGCIQSTGGELFRSPMQWCAALLHPNGARNCVRRSQAYDKVLYNGTPLSNFKLQIASKESGTTANVTQSDSQAGRAEAFIINGLTQQQDAHSSLSYNGIFLMNELRIDSVRILSDMELMPNKPLLPQCFWGVHTPARDLPEELVQCIDCW